MSIVLTIYIIGAIAAVILTIVLQTKEIVKEGNSIGENLILYTVMGAISWYAVLLLLLYYYYHKTYKQ